MPIECHFSVRYTPKIQKSKIPESKSIQIAEDYALTYYPTIYKICPNRLATEIGQVGSVEEIYNSIQNCDQAQLPFDIGFLAYTGTENSCI